MQSDTFDGLIKAGRIFLIILSVFFVILSLAALRATGEIGAGTPATNTITVSGEGEVFAVPDIAEFSFAVVEERETAEAAQVASAESTNAIISYLEENNVDEKDIKTTSYNLYPRYEYHEQQIVCVRAPCPQPPRERVLVGYEVNQQVSVKVRLPVRGTQTGDTEVAGELLAGVGERGATNISGLAFTIDDEDALQREARQQAIDDAKEKAEALADDLDVDLVRIVNFHEEGRPVPYYARGFDGDAALDVFEETSVPDVPVGENKIISRVSITYEIR